MNVKAELRELLVKGAADRVDLEKLREQVAEGASDFVKYVSEGPWDPRLYFQAHPEAVNDPLQVEYRERMRRWLLEGDDSQMARLVELESILPQFEAFRKAHPDFGPVTQ
jgi:hypothetical protein